MVQATFVSLVLKICTALELLIYANQGKKVLARQTVCSGSAAARRSGASMASQAWPQPVGIAMLLFGAGRKVVRRRPFIAAAVDMLRRGPLYCTTCVFKNFSLIFDLSRNAATPLPTNHITCSLIIGKDS